MKRIPMSRQARIEAAERKRKRVRAAKIAIVGLVITTAAMWGYVLLTG